MLLLEALEQTAPSLTPIVCIAFAIAFVLAFSVGANDVSNSFGTSVGARVLTVTQACILATIFEMAGATLLGYSVCDNLREDMYDKEQFKADDAIHQKELLLGCLSSLLASALWNLLATALKMPISGSHSIVGATVGFLIVLRPNSVPWFKILKIAASWFASPLLSGLISSLIYAVISKTIICKIDALHQGLRILPMFYGATIFINVVSITVGNNSPGLKDLSWYAGLFIAYVCAAITICCIALWLVPKLRRDIIDELATSRNNSTKQFPPNVHNYDNPSFKPDEDIGNTGAKKSNMPEKPKRINRRKKSSTVQIHPVSLDPVNLQEDTKTADSSSKPQGAVEKPPVAPKPAHLRRQIAQDVSRDETDEAKNSKQEKFDEIDLSKDTTSEQAKENVIEIVSENKEKEKEKVPGTTGKDIERGHGTPTNEFSLETPASKRRSSLLSCGERYEIARLFSSLQILTACFASFAHGSNDVSNALFPLIPIWHIYEYGHETSDKTEIWLLFFGGIGIWCGLWAWGRVVMGTISDGLTKITPSKGFSVELGAAISVLIASKLGLPISTTHCKVGSLIIVGYVSGKFLAQDRLLDQAMLADRGLDNFKLEIIDDNKEEGNVDWKMFGNIAITWIATVPTAALMSAAITWLLNELLIDHI